MAGHLVPPERLDWVLGTVEVRFMVTPDKMGKHKHIFDKESVPF